MPKRKLVKVVRLKRAWAICGSCSGKGGNNKVVIRIFSCYPRLYFLCDNCLQQLKDEIAAIPCPDGWWLEKDCRECWRYPDCDLIEHVSKPRGCSLWASEKAQLRQELPDNEDTER